MRAARPKRRWLVPFTVTLTLASSVTAVVLADDQPATHRVKRSTVARLPVRPPPFRARRLIIGYSVAGRAIYAIHLGARHSRRSILIVGCIHGDESAGIAIARQLSTGRPPPAASLWIIPDLNPDGVAAGTRQNARGIDLNRNFPWHWQQLGVLGDLQYSGPRPLSEPEA